jgi:uncharacterized protein (TIGR00730 family)
MKWITLFCGAKVPSEKYENTALEFARWMIEKNYGLVYGGGSTGMMGVVAKHLIKNKIPVVGVIPESLLLMEVGLKECTELIVTQSMHERKKIMSERGDAFIALPGGFGTLDEVCEIITWRQLNLLSKPIAFLDAHDYFLYFKKFSQHAVDEGFISSKDFLNIQWLKQIQEFSWNRP